MASVALIINNKSNRSASVLGDIKAVCDKYKDVRFYELDGILGLDIALKSINREKAETVILAGGDGTVQAGFTDIINHQRFDVMPYYVLLPCGMTNVIANDCGLRGEPAGALDDFLRRYEQGSVKKVTRSLMSVQSGNEDPVHGFFFGAGAFHSAVQFSRSNVQSKGAKRSVALLLSIMGYVYKIAFAPDDTIETIAVNYLSGDLDREPGAAHEALFMATTLTKLGSGVFPFWSDNTRAMAVTTVRTPLRRLLRAAPSVLRGKSRPWFKDYGYRSWSSDHLTFSFDGPYVFDGEIFQTKEQFPIVIDTSHKINFLT